MNEYHPVSDTNSVVLWKNGETITVPIDSSASLQKDGWLANSPETIPTMVQDIKLYAEQVALNISQFVDAVTIDGVIDAHDGAIYEASLKSRSLLDSRISELLTLVHALYPMKQGPTISMIDLEGVDHEIDPNQETEYAALGWSRR